MILFLGGNGERIFKCKDCTAPVLYSSLFRKKTTIRICNKERK